MSLVALTSIGVLACEYAGVSSGEGSLEIVSLGQRASAQLQRARGTITVRGLHDGALHLVSTSSEAGTRTLRLAPGLYSVTAATELGLEGFETRTPPRLEGTPALVRIDPGATAVVRVRFDSLDANAFAAGQRAPTRSALDYQDVSGSLTERAQLCRPTGNGCDEPSAFAPPLPTRGSPERSSPERSVLDRNPL
ncbi:MAG: hypothetical protein ABW217_15735 [Polyangiaceae bacterium]